MELFFRIKIAS